MEARTLLRLPQSFQACLRSRITSSFNSRRQLSSSPSSSATDNASTLGPLAGSLGRSTLGSLAGSLRSSQEDQQAKTKTLEEYSQEEARLPEHHLHVFATKHNCHISLTAPSHMTPLGPRRKTIITLSSGNIGFRKAARGTYDAAFQLGAYMLSRIQNQGLLRDIQRVELVFRGFGPGREAVTKILTGVEGEAFRDRIVRVVDATRLKFGGTRSKKIRRL